MDAIVLAGGYATRLWPITKNRPKMLLPIGEQTVIGTVFEELEADDRIDDVYVSTNEKFAGEFESYLAGSPYEKPQVSVEETTAESEKFGVVGALGELVDRENLSDDTLVVAGDNLICFEMGSFIDEFEANGAPTLAAYDVGSYERASSYGLVELDGNEVVDFQEKPDEPKSTLVSIACYAFPSETLSLFSTYLDGENNPDEPGWFIQWLQDRRTVNAFTFDEAWFDIGTPESYLDAIAWQLDGENVVHRDAETEDVELQGNVQIMADAEVTDTTLSNSIVFPDATITNSELRRSIVDKESRVDSLNLSGAVVGAHTHLNGD
ncbi:NTP transferase domain-containing protein [Halovenus sp. WSH3]|uniref:NTP transferase domain-containing protein n=1 Tax=Halovenus carboxidivorans TaxID=2692199 RepID=A0A6B0TB11_9EURY|nr:NDP-sugar synthase [Halovenus carboxidivorans]MXR52592.1 NTP transferase domain-containing protein [Halovenus carboxidivorans]